MEEYDKDWPEFMKGQPLAVIVDNFEKLDKIAKQYNKDLESLINEKTKQDLNYAQHKMNKKWDIETPKKKIYAEYKSAFDKQVENYYRNEAIKAQQRENKQDITEAVLEKEEAKIENGNELDPATKAAINFKENKEDVEKDKSKLSKEEKLAEEKVNAKDITGAQKQREKEREEFIAEMQAARERNREREHERER